MQSLRTRRPSEQKNIEFDPTTPIPRPKQQQRITKENRDARKSRVGDKIKKRMSMRYAEISEPAPVGRGPGVGMPALPSMPEVPLGRTMDRQRPRQEGYDRPLRELVDDEPDEVQQDPLIIDTKVLEQPNFDPDAYLKVKLAHSTEAELKSLRSSLEASKAATAADLQRNVFKNYAEFVLISKEISTLENDMLELKESLSEWRNMPTLLNIEENPASASVADRRRTNRSSIADLRTLYAAQLQELHTQIEGSSKYVPVIPGRHIVSETGDLWALNSATYKVEHAVHMVLLDDSLLVAKKRKKRSGEGGKLVAEKCWSLGEIVLVDVKDTVDLTNVFKIRRSKETNVYRTDRLSDKKVLLSTFRQVAEELSTKKRKEREGEHERRRSVWTGDRMSMAVGPAPMPALPPWLADLQSKGLGGAGSGKEKEDNEVKRLNEFTDKLAVAIALREWDEAVKLLEQGASFLSSGPASSSNAPSILPPKVETLKQTLVSDLLHALSDPTHRKQAVGRISSFLIRLGLGTAARDTFLATRAELIRKGTRSIRFEGNISLYISELALVTFTLIKNTSEWYLASFKEHDMASGMVQWAKEQIVIYAKMFQRQVYGPDTDSQTIQDSIQVTKLQSKRLLQDNGLDFSFVLDELIGPPASKGGGTTPSAVTPAASVAGSAISSQGERPPRQTRTPVPTARTPGPLPQRSRDRPVSIISTHSGVAK